MSRSTYFFREGANISQLIDDLKKVRDGISSEEERKKAVHNAKMLVVALEKPEEVVMHYIYEMRMHDYFRGHGYTCPTNEADCAFQWIFGTQERYFEYIHRHPQKVKDFNTFMGGIRETRKHWTDWYPVEEQLLDGFPGGEEILLVDVGGGNGHDLEKFMAKYPESKGHLMLQDLPVVIEGIAHLSEGIQSMPHDIFQHQAIKVLEPFDIVRCQSVSRRFWTLTRDNNLWKTICFEDSRAGALRRRQELVSSLDERLAMLRQAVNSISGESGTVHDGGAPNAEMSAHGIRARERMRALANWDPSYPNEKIDFYQEYIHRHAPITMNWLQTVSDITGGGNEPREATGIGLLREDGEYGAEKAVAPLDDGSICIFDISPWSGHGPKSQGRMTGRSDSGLLTSPPTNLDKDSAREHSKTMMTETGAVECVSIDSIQRKGFFAVQNALNEVDLNTMQVVSRNRFPFPITALSEARPSIPLT
ncbi:MAG: hypothetical protein Q9157_006862, partial [Trypethelium eluteriae]